MPELTCPIRDCRRTRSAEHAMCGPCWKQVPADLAREVYRTWQERRRARRTTVEGTARTRAVRDHLQALENAEAAVEGREARDLFSTSTSTS